MIQRDDCGEKRCWTSYRFKLSTLVQGLRKTTPNSWSSQYGTLPCQYIYIVTVCGTICSVRKGEKQGLHQLLCTLPIHNAGDNRRPSISHLVIMEMNKQLEKWKSLDRCRAWNLLPLMQVYNLRPAHRCWPTTQLYLLQPTHLRYLPSKCGPVRSIVPVHINITVPPTVNYSWLHRRNQTLTAVVHQILASHRAPTE
jgi:hypothetical protein